MSASPHTLHRRIGATVAAFGLAALSLTIGSGSARAADSGSAFVSFTNNTDGGVYTCEVTMPSGVGHPPTQPHQLSWRSVVVCGVVVRMYGVSASYVWGSDIAYYPGSSYDVTATIAETVGRVNVPPGAWGMNNNVIIFTPAGYTATPGNGCAAVAADQTKCTATAGPVMVS